MRGEIFYVEDGEGVITAEDGTRYPYREADVRGNLPHAGDLVDFLVEDGVVNNIVRLSRAASFAPIYARDGAAFPAPEPDTSPWGYFVRCVTRKYAGFHGRSPRREFWWFILFRYLFIIGLAAPGFVLIAISESTGARQGGPLEIISSIFMVLAALFYVATIIPNLAGVVRRLHDMGQSGWLVLINAVPYVGPLVVFVLTVLPSQPFANVHGPVPGQAPTSTADVFS